MTGISTACATSAKSPDSAEAAPAESSSRAATPDRRRPAVERDEDAVVMSWCCLKLGDSTVYTEALFPGVGKIRKLE
jgi:hypothetical protein